MADWYITYTYNNSTTTAGTSYYDNMWNLSSSDNYYYTLPAVVYVAPTIPARTVSDWVERVVPESIEAFKAREEANKRAETLLLRHLTPRQRQMYLDRKRFYIRSKTTDNVYEISEGTTHNIHRVNPRTHKRIEELCVLPEDRKLPTADVVLAQKLHIEHNEAELREAANIWSLRSGKRIFVHKGTRGQIAA